MLIESFYIAQPAFILLTDLQQFTGKNKEYENPRKIKNQERESNRCVNGGHPGCCH